MICCSSLASLAMDRVVDCSALRKISKQTLNLPSLVRTLWASLTRAWMLPTEKRVTGARSLFFKLPSDNRGQFKDGACGMLGDTLQVAQKASLKTSSSGSGLTRPMRLFSTLSASSNSPAATRSHGNFRFLSHFTCAESATEMFVARSSTVGVSSTGRSIPSNPKSMSSPQAPCAPAAVKSPTSSSAQMPPSPVSSGTSSASRKLKSTWRDSCTFSNFFSLKI
mmetsp:Transcript_12238/g.27733  ORF Transcript_12238/g.27733 Transcript_12238/m.27733 type:complete len:223 (+) Transcript_12238:583-1251(+)